MCGRQTGTTCWGWDDFCFVYCSLFPRAGPELKLPLAHALGQSWILSALQRFGQGRTPLCSQELGRTFDYSPLFFKIASIDLFFFSFSVYNIPIKMCLQQEYVWDLGNFVFPLDYDSCVVAKWTNMEEKLPSLQHLNEFTALKSSLYYFPLLFVCLCPVVNCFGRSPPRSFMTNKIDETGDAECW